MIAVVGLFLVGCGSGGSSGGGGGGGGSGNTGGGSSAGGGTGGVDTLLGIWTDQVTPENTDNQSFTLVFSAMNFTLVHTEIISSTASAKPGCTESYSDQGSYTESAGKLMVQVDVPNSGLYADIYCKNQSDEGPSNRTPVTMSGTWSYSINGDTLTLTFPGGMPMTFQRH
jgi:hypothetical protein